MKTLSLMILAAAVSAAATLTVGTANAVPPHPFETLAPCALYSYGAKGYMLGVEGLCNRGEGNTIIFVPTK